MTDREKLMTSLSQCARGNCIMQDAVCQYWDKCGKSNAIETDALAALREDADELEQLRDQVHNLTLYLQYVERTVPTIVESMITQFSGMPGYAGVRGVEE